jgi:hypothetical protein
MLDDGTRLPHYLGTTRTDPRVLDSDNFNNYAIRIGEVVAIHYPDDPTNRTKREIEYTVNVQYRRGNGPPVNTPYHCTVADPLGTAGDSSRQTLRASRGEKAGDSLTDGARVLIACPNGETSSAVIISGVKHHRAARDPVRANGDYLSRFFNGVEIAINDQGELSITNPRRHAQRRQPRRQEPRHPQPGHPGRLPDGRLGHHRQQGRRHGQDRHHQPTHLHRHEGHGHRTEQSWTVSAGGDVAIQAGGNVQIGAAGTLRLGGDGAGEPLVLGNSLLAALRDLVQAFLAGPIGIISGPNILPHPTLIARLSQWLAKYCNPVAPYLASNKFTER